MGHTPDIRQVTKTDVLNLTQFFKSLSQETIDSYGRWDSLKHNEEIYAYQQCGKSEDEEIGFILFDDYAYFQGPPVGYAHLTFSPWSKWTRRHSCSFGVVVNQDYQGRGYGEQLLKTAIKIAKKSKKKKIWLHVYDFNKPAIKLYEKNGFMVEGIFKKEEFKNRRYVNIISMAKWI